MGSALMRLCVSLTWLVFILGVHGAAGFTVDDEIKLKRKLLLNSSDINGIRPDRVTKVELSFNLLAINDVDIKNERFSVSGWWAMKWTDRRLSWLTDPDHSGIGVIQVLNSQIWTPALVVDNAVKMFLRKADSSSSKIKDLSTIHEDTIPIRVRRDGKVTWNPPGILETSCDMDVTYFPFDTQICSIQVTSFGYTIKELDIAVHSSLSLTYYQENGEWVILDNWNAREEYEDDNYEYAKVTFFVKIQRRATYYGLNTILPVLLTSMLIPLVFLLPHHSGEKIGYCLTVLLAYVVILTIVSDGLPTTAKNLSLLGVYIAIVLCMGGLSVFLAIHSLYLFHCGPEKPIPDWVAKLTRRSLKIMWCQCSKSKVNTTTSSAEGEPVDRLRQPSRQNARASSGKRGSAISSSAVNTEMVHGDQVSMSWQLVAEAYDAVLLRIYFVIIIIISIAFTLAVASNQF